jgi:hypothetical protein
MMRRTLTFGISWLLLVCLAGQARGGGILTQVETETQSTSAAGVLVPTNWSAGTKGINDPLVLDKFDSTLGQLTSIQITLTTTIRNDYEVFFPTTTTPTTIDLATSQTSDPSVLADPAKRALLTDGPSVTLMGPNGATLFGAGGTRQPVDFVSLTESSGTYSSMLPTTSPFFIAPTLTTQTFTRTLTPTDSLFNQFIGTGKVAMDLPIAATAYSSFYSSSGNGGGAVFTDASASVSIQFTFVPLIQPQTIPEPSSVVLLGLGATALVFLGMRRCRRAETPS